MSTSIERPRIASHITRTRFLHVEDSLAHRKLRLFIGAYEQGHGASATAFAFLDLNDARVLLSDMSWGKQIDYCDYKGGKDSDGKVTSRVLKIQFKAEQGKGGRFWIEIQNGPGEMVGPNGVKPSGKPLADISIPFTIFEVRKFAHACLAYIQVWDTRHLLWGSESEQQSVGSDQ